MYVSLSLAAQVREYWAYTEPKELSVRKHFAPREKFAEKARHSRHWSNEVPVNVSVPDSKSARIVLRVLIHLRI